MGRDLYRQCLDADPSFAPAWAKLGRCHRLLAKYSLERPAENMTQAEACFRRALELDPQLTVAHKLYAHHESEMGHAREAMVRLLGLARSTRNDPEIFAGLVHACRYCGLLSASVAAHDLAPCFDPRIRTSAPDSHFAHGEYQRALAESAHGFDSVDCVILDVLGRADEARVAALREEERFASHEHARIFYSAMRRCSSTAPRTPARQPSGRPCHGSPMARPSTS